MNHNGITAYSESVTDENPFYGSEDNYIVFHIVKQYLAPVVKNLPEPDEFNEQVKFIKGNNMAKLPWKCFSMIIMQKQIKNPWWITWGK